MENLPFSKWDPSGNLTLLFPSLDRENPAELASQAMGESFVPAEQAGFYDVEKMELRMAGGEFCVNATRSFGALLAMESERKNGLQNRGEFTVKVSGWQTPIKLITEGTFPEWKVEAKLEIPECPMSREEGACTVFFPGITHLLLDTRAHPVPRKNLKEEGLRMLLDRGLTNVAASGAIWWEKTERGYAITPVVYAKEAGTLFAESACGSATLALSLFLLKRGKGNRFLIRQPSQDWLETAFEEEGKKASICGTVRLRAEGTLALG